MNKESNQAGRVFEQAFCGITNVITFDPTWANGTGYFDGAVKVPMAIGAVAKSNDTAGRRIILIGTRFGTVVVFDRYSGQTDGGVYVHNHRTNKLLKTTIGDSNISGSSMENILDWFDPAKRNIGHLIEEIYAEIKKGIAKEAIPTEALEKLNSALRGIEYEVLFDEVPK